MSRQQGKTAARAIKPGGLLSYDSLKDGFNVESFLSQLMKDVLTTKRYDPRNASEVSAAATNFKLSLETVQRLLKTFERVDAELEIVNKDATEQVAELQYNVTRAESEYRAEVKMVERGLEGVKDAFRALENHMVRVSQTATRIGDRLQTAETMRIRAQETTMLLGHLQQFSLLDEDDDEFRSLPTLFYADGELPLAAATTRKLVALVQEVQLAKQRTRMGSEESREPERIVPGSLEHTARRLEEYCQWLEHRVTSRFDKAAQEKNILVMAECSHIMTQFDRERTLIQRYVASRAVFLDAKEDWFSSSVLQSEDPAERLKPLQHLYREFLGTVKDETATMQTVFSSPKMAMELLLQRIFEEKIQVAVERVLPPPGPRASAEAIRTYMRLVADAYERTGALVVQMEKNANGLVDLGHVVDGLFSAFLTDYPAMELRWLQMSFDYEVRSSDTPELQRDLMQQLMEWNAEAVSRCSRLAPGSQAARAVRQLFHASSYARAHTGCLLEQLARHIITGVEYSLELCTAGSMSTTASLGIASVSRAHCGQLADAFVNDRIGKVLETTRAAGEVMALLQAHYASVILPAVAASISEHSACMGGLSSLLKAVEDAILGALRKCIDTFITQVERVLAVEQKRGDFAPREDAVPQFDRPTTACMLLTSMLRALRTAAAANLEAANQQSFMYEVGSRTMDALAAHMQRFMFSPMGALQWKKDCAEYGEQLRELDCPPITERMSQLQALVNVLIVAPDSLLGLVNGTLRMSHKDVLRYIALREDFRSARVEGKTLQQLFTEETMEEAVPRGGK